MLRLPYLNEEYCQQIYDDAQRVAAFEFRNQSSWYSQAHALVQLARLAYVVGRPFAECRANLREAVLAFEQLFSLRGQSFSTVTKYRKGRPVSVEKQVDDGYTSADCFLAATVCLLVHDAEQAHKLMELAGHSPNAHLVSPKSEVCTTNRQTLSHALNALVSRDFERALHETSKLEVRRTTREEQRLGAVMSALARDGDVLSELEALIAEHEKTARSDQNRLDATFFLCLPALGLTKLALCLGRLESPDAVADSPYAPHALLHDD